MHSCSACVGPASEKFPVVVTSYEIVIADSKLLQRYTWKYVIVDEGHRLKNFNCKLLRELRQIPVDNKLLLTGVRKPRVTACVTDIACSHVPVCSRLNAGLPVFAYVYLCCLAHPAILVKYAQHKPSLICVGYQALKKLVAIVVCAQGWPGQPAKAHLHKSGSFEKLWRLLC